MQYGSDNKLNNMDCPRRQRIADQNHEGEQMERNIIFRHAQMSLEERMPLLLWKGSWWGCCPCYCFADAVAAAAAAATASRSAVAQAASPQPLPTANAARKHVGCCPCCEHGAASDEQDAVTADAGLRAYPASSKMHCRRTALDINAYMCTYAQFTCAAWTRPSVIRQKGLGNITNRQKSKDILIPAMGTRQVDVGSIRNRERSEIQGYPIGHGQTQI